MQASGRYGGLSDPLEALSSFQDGFSKGIQGMIMRVDVKKWCLFSFAGSKCKQAGVKEAKVCERAGCDRG